MECLWDLGLTLWILFRVWGMRNRYYKDHYSCFAILCGFQAISPRPGSGLSNALTDVTDTDPSDLPGQVEEVEEEKDPALDQEPENNTEDSPADNIEEPEENGDMDEDPPEESEEIEKTNDDMKENEDVDDEMD